MDSNSGASAQHVLATDLDGTLIPIGGDEGQRRCLGQIADALNGAGLLLVFVTGRHFASTMGAIRDFELPAPDWIICDVGTSVYRRKESGHFELEDAYVEQLRSMISACSVETLSDELRCFGELRLQEQEKQGAFKLSYYAEASELQRLIPRLESRIREMSAPYSIVHSVDPFNGDGLVDFLPLGVSKAYALRWWSAKYKFSTSQILFAGDSGNDLAALTAGYRSIVVGNANRKLAENVSQMHAQAGWRDRLYLATAHASSGVLEGLIHYKVIR